MRIETERAGSVARAVASCIRSSDRMRIETLSYGFLEGGQESCIRSSDRMRIETAWWRRDRYASALHPVLGPDED